MKINGDVQSARTVFFKPMMPFQDNLFQNFYKVTGKQVAFTVNENLIIATVLLIIQI